MRRFLSIATLASLALCFWNSTVRAELTYTLVPKKIQVLIITGDDVDVHRWKETTPAIRKILVDSGKFDVQVSEDLKPLESADTLKAYDVLLLNRFTHGPVERRSPAEPLGFRPRRQRTFRRALLQHGLPMAAVTA